MDVRAVAARVINDVLQRQGSLASLLPPALDSLPSNNQPLLQQLCYGTCRYLPSLQALLHALLHKPLSHKDQDIQALLLVGLYQLQHSRIAEHAIISETVDAATQLGKPWAKSLINAVLRNFQRQPELLQQLQKQPPVRYAHPQWIIDRLKGNWPEHWESILANNNLQAPMTLRVNLSKTSRENYLQSLQKAEIPARPGRYSAAAITLEQPIDVFKLPNFTDGWVSVQDEAAQLAGYLMDLQPGQIVLDACAAPGGKTCHLLEIEPQLASVIALDQSPERLQRVTENLQRLGFSANTLCADACTQDWWNGQPFDRILLDAPCSATGVIRRHPDIKYLRQNKDIGELAKLQERMLRNLWALLKPGGRLVYATCSVMANENEAVIKRFLKKHEDAQEISIAADWGIKRPAGRQLFPQADSHDGFYYAVLNKQP